MATRRTAVFGTSALASFLSLVGCCLVKMHRKQPNVCVIIIKMIVLSLLVAGSICCHCSGLLMGRRFVLRQTHHTLCTIHTQDMTIKEHNNQPAVDATFPTTTRKPKLLPFVALETAYVLMHSVMQAPCRPIINHFNLS